ncbi:hypothetical protein D7X88_13895 [bacterium C-53]|nr:hypothetical protein [Lachnospiraceae bacterium]NBI04078.1 hypothetical protein [Lachnospiraceae bacterium]RKJ08731.1 hypothetical protein D7X88_13895 [bacterium C-53]
MYYYTLYSIKRRKTANLITIGISVMLVILLNLYFGSIRSYQSQLDDLARNIPIFCQITNGSGSLGNGLFISEKLVDSLRQSDAVADESCMTVLMAGEGDFPESEYMRHLNLYVAGANRPEAVGELTYDMIHMEKEGMDALFAAVDFFSSDRLECIVSEKVMKKRKWEIGDRILLKFYYYGADSVYTKLELHPMGGTAEFEIVGSMEDLLGKTSAAGTDIILPFDTLKKVYHEFKIPFFADTFTFHVKNPLKLNAFKEEMKSIGLLETAQDTADSYTGCALIVRDNTFIIRAEDLNHSIEMMQSFFPAVCILVLLIGYVVSYLAGSSRKGEYVLLRLQGVGKWKGAFLFLAEQMLLVFIGTILGDGIVMLMTHDLYRTVVVNGVLLAAYFAGAIAAYGRKGEQIWIK